MENPISFIKKQYEQVRKGGGSLLLFKMRRIFDLMLFVVLFIPALAVVLIIRVCRPVIIVRFGKLISARIGHFAANTELYMCERDMGLYDKRVFDVFYYEAGPICNRQLNKMFKRIIPISRYTGVVDAANRIFPGYEAHVLAIPSDRDTKNLLTQTRPHVSFTRKEENFGIKEMRHIGIPDGVPFVCFHARDEAYLNMQIPSCDWTYHNYRDSDIHTYIPAVEELARRGCYSVRMGAVVKDALKTSNPRIIDYATKNRTDFLDIYLPSKCRFFISSGTGIDSVAVMFRKPVMVVNYVPLEYVNSWIENGLFIIKKLWLRKEKRLLTFPEILNSGIGRFLRGEQYERYGIDVIDNTPEEITDLAIEMDERLKGNWRSTEEDEMLQERFRSYFKSSKLHGRIMIRLGAQFLRDNKELLG